MIFKGPTKAYRRHKHLNWYGKSDFKISIWRELVWFILLQCRWPRTNKHESLHDRVVLKRRVIYAMIIKYSDIYYCTDCSNIDKFCCEKRPTGFCLNLRIPAHIFLETWFEPHLKDCTKFCKIMNSNQDNFLAFKVYWAFKYTSLISHGLAFVVLEHF